MDTFEVAVDGKLNDLRDMLLRKNKAYGNSALEPVRVFSRANAAEQLRVRIDDKLSRMMKGSTYADEDTIFDLLGYLVLLQIAQDEDGPTVSSEPSVGTADQGAAVASAWSVPVSPVDYPHVTYPGISPGTTAERLTAMEGDALPLVKRAVTYNVPLDELGEQGLEPGVPRRIREELDRAVEGMSIRANGLDAFGPDVRARLERNGIDVVDTP